VVVERRGGYHRTMLSGTAACWALLCFSITAPPPQPRAACCRHQSLGGHGWCAPLLHALDRLQGAPPVTRISQGSWRGSPAAQRGAPKAQGSPSASSIEKGAGLIGLARVLSIPMSSRNPPSADGLGASFEAVWTTAASIGRPSPNPGHY